MPNWAELHEISLSLKAPHSQVKYVSQSLKPEKCGNCRNFIPDHPNRCRTVECPINSLGWCERYAR